MKHKISHILMENLGLKIMAFVFASLLWLIVVNNDDPIDTMTLRSIPVQVENDEEVLSDGKMYQILDETESVTVTITAKRSVLTKIKTDDIVATADFKEMELLSLVPITVSIKGHEGEYQSAVANPHNLRVKIDEVERLKFALTVSTKGTLRDGYVLGSTKTNPETITIGGSESLVNSIDKAVASINISGMSESGNVKADLYLYDSEGSLIDQTRLSNNLGDKGLSVDVEVLETKNLPIVTTVSGTPADGYVFKELSYLPEKIAVYGKKEDLDMADSIQIPSEEINIDGASEKKEFTIDITQYLPENLELVDESQNSVLVTASIDEAGTKTIELPPESITVNNLASSLKMEYVNADNLQLQFQGEQETLDKINVKNSAFMDLKNYTTAGEYEVPITFELPSGVKILGDPKVKIKISNK